MSFNISIVSTFNSVTMQINRHGASLMLLFGTLGNVMNIIVLNEHTLHENPCSIYLCWSSISSTILLWTGLLTRVLQGYNVNWPNENNPFCKIRLYFLNVSWGIGIWCLVGANMDRFLCSSLEANYRRWSTTRIAKRFIIVISILFGILFIEIIYCFEASVPNVPVACYGRNLPCQLFNDWIFISIDIILPTIFLSIFGALTIRNVRSRIVYPVTNLVNTNNNKPVIRNNDRNLTRMLLIQVLFVLILGLPFGIYRPYASLTSNISKSAYRVALENLIYSLVTLLVFSTHSTSFYLYTLTGSLYRAAFRRIVRRCLNRIQPAGH